MGKYIVSGGNVLSGEVNISGAKNSVLPILCASILCRHTLLYNCPALSDTYTTLSILKSLGCKTEFEQNTIDINTHEINQWVVDKELSRQLRSSVIFLGGLLAKFKKALISSPGGCQLGKRPIDIHISALKQMGVIINEENGTLYCDGENMVGCEIALPFPSVGATENIMLAALGAKGTTTVINPAKEPEITDLQNFLICMGANVSGAGTDRIVIEGGTADFDFCEFTIMPDRIETGTYLIAAAITGGEIFINNAVPDHVKALTEVLENMGCIIKQDNSTLYMEAAKLKNIDKITTNPYPLFPTDLQPQIMSLCCVSKGSVVIEETLFESRYRHIPFLINMGAEINMLSNRKFLVNGVKKLYGTEVEATDLRCGAALIIAGLAAQGQTVINNSHHKQRCYENIFEKLSALGAEIIYKP